MRSHPIQKESFLEGRLKNHYFRNDFSFFGAAEKVLSKTARRVPLIYILLDFA